MQHNHLDTPGSGFPEKDISQISLRMPTEPLVQLEGRELSLTLRGHSLDGLHHVSEIELSLRGAGSGEPIFRRSFILSEPETCDHNLLRRLEDAMKSGNAPSALLALLNQEFLSKSTHRLRDSFLCDSTKMSGSDLQKLALDFNIAPLPLQVRDTLTGFRAKAALLSEDSLQELNVRLGPKMLVHFLDFDNMGPPNKFGMKAEVNAVLTAMPQLARISFRDIPHEVFRVGGDEFAVLIQDRGEESVQALANFADGIRSVRQRYFLSDDPRYQMARVYSVLRSFGREWLAGYKLLTEQARQPFSLLAFADYVANRCGDYFLYSKSGYLRPEQRLAYLAQNIHKIENRALRARVVGDEIKVMGITSATVRSAEPLTVSKLLLSLAMAEMVIHFNKEHPGNIFDRALDLDDSRQLNAQHRSFHHKVKYLRLRDADMKQAALAAETEAAYKRVRAEIAGDSPAGQLRESFQQLLKLSGSDSSSNRVLRANLIWNLPLNELMDFRVPGPRLYMVEVDIQGFGALNNQLGYERSDQLFARLVEAVARPGDLLLRQNGGGLLIISQTTVAKKLPDKKELEKIIFESIKSDHRPKAEYILRHSLDALFRGTTEKGRQELSDFVFPEVTIRDRSVAYSQGMTAGSLIELLQSS